MRILTIIFVLFLSCIQTHAIQICDGGDYSQDCKQENLINSIQGIMSFTGSYSSISPGAMGSKFQEKPQTTLEYDVPVGGFGTNHTSQDDFIIQNTITTGYWGNLHSKGGFTEANNYVPVGNFHEYIGKNIDFLNSGTSQKESKKSLVNTIDQRTISQRDMFYGIFGSQYSEQKANQDLYYLYEYINYSSDLSYGAFSLFLVNIYGEFVIKNKDYSYLLAKQLGWITNENAIGDFVKQSDFELIVLTLKGRDNLNSQVLENIDTIVKLNQKQVAKEFGIILQLNIELSRLEKEKEQDFYSLKSCLEYIECTNRELYQHTLNKVQKNNDYSSKILSGGALDYQGLFRIIFDVHLQKIAQEKKIKLSKKNYLLEILTHAMSYGEEQKNMKVGFLSYNRMKLLLLNSSLYDNLSNIADYTDEIIYLYDNMEDKSRLLDVLKNYSFR